MTGKTKSKTAHIPNLAQNVTGQFKFRSGSIQWNSVFNERHFRPDNPKMYMKPDKIASN